MPYLFTLFLGIGLLIVTVLSGVLQFVGTRSIMVSAMRARSTKSRSFCFMASGLPERDLAAHRDLFRHAGGSIVAASRADQRRDGYAAFGK
jgi:hypothetical protein